MIVGKTFFFYPISWHSSRPTDSHWLKKVHEGRSLSWSSSITTLRVVTLQVHLSSLSWIIGDGGSGYKDQANTSSWCLPPTLSHRFISGSLAFSSSPQGLLKVVSYLCILVGLLSCGKAPLQVSLCRFPQSLRLHLPVPATTYVRSRVENGRE